MISKKLIGFLNNTALSGEEFTLLYLIYLSKEEDITVDFNKYISNNNGKYDYLNLFNNLEKQGFLENLNKKGEWNLDKLKITSKFTDALFVPIDLAWEEVLRAYPKFIDWKDNEGRQKTTPTFKNLDKNKLAYQQKIENRKDLHIEFMGVMDNYLLRNNGRAVYNFDSFLDAYDGIRLAFEDIAANGNMADDFEIG